ncbi:MAG: hypothetical protein WAW61_09960 [Methylococcaceae bacterium]
MKNPPWHKPCLENPCPLSSYLEKFVQLIPESLSKIQKASATDFTRSRKLSVSKLIAFLITLLAKRKALSIDGKSDEFFKQARGRILSPGVAAVLIVAQ